MTLTSSEVPQLDGLDLDLGDSPRVGELALLALTIAARDRSLEGISRNVPELTSPGYDAPHIALLEGMAVLAGQVLYRANVLPLALMLQLFGAAGLPYLGASAASVDLYVDGAAEDRIWVAGSLVAAGRVTFEVARTVTVPAGATAWGPVPLIATQAGPVGNVQANYGGWVVVTPFPFTNLQNPQPGQGGANAETEEEYLARLGDLFAARGTGTTAADLVALAQNILGVQRTLVLEHSILRNAARWGQFRWNYADWGSQQDLLDAPGCATIVVRPRGGGTLNSELLGRLSEALEPRRPVGNLLYYASVEEVPVDVNVVAYLNGRRPQSVVQRDIETRVAEWLTGATWPWGGALRQSAVEEVVGNAPGLDFSQPFTVTINPDPERVYVAPIAGVDDPYMVPYDPGLHAAWSAIELASGRVTAIKPRYPNFMFRLRTINVTLLLTEEQGGTGELPPQDR